MLSSHDDAGVPAPAEHFECDRCGGGECVDSPVHAGASLRRDCLLCGRFADFPRWAPPPRWRPGMAVGDTDHHQAYQAATPPPTPF